MIAIRRARERGHTRLPWLDSRHTFSFGDYHDPENMGFRALRVINEDRVMPGKGFNTHGHRDMEILSFVLDGALEHQDSMGTGSVIRPGDVQRMTAGTGVMHSEFNHSATEPVHFLQVWILPDRAGLRPGYEQRSFPEENRRGVLRLVASPDGRDESITVHQHVTVYAASLAAGETVTHALGPGRHAWVQVARGAVAVDGETLREGDGAAVANGAEGPSPVLLRADESSEVVVFDLA